MNDNLTDENFLLYAAKNYNNPSCYDTLEFYDDLKRFKYIKRLFGIYLESGDLRDRLILNHIIVLYNVFGIEPATRMLFFKLYDYQPQLKPFLELLNYMPTKIINIGYCGETIYNNTIAQDEGIQEKLRRI